MIQGNTIKNKKNCRLQEILKYIHRRITCLWENMQEKILHSIFIMQDFEKYIIWQNFFKHCYSKNTTPTSKESLKMKPMFVKKGIKVLVSWLHPLVGPSFFIKSQSERTSNRFPAAYSTV